MSTACLATAATRVLRSRLTALETASRATAAGAPYHVVPKARPRPTPAKTNSARSRWRKLRTRNSAAQPNVPSRNVSGSSWTKAKLEIALTASTIVANSTAVPRDTRSSIAMA